MKHRLLHIIYIGALLLMLPACSHDEGIIDTPEQNIPESRAGITARIAVPDPITADGENITINTVRLFVFDTDGACLAKSDQIPVTEANVSIEDAKYESDHVKQYVVTIETGLTLPKPTSIRSYEVYAVINEQMGGTEGNSNYLGITTPADWSGKLANVTDKAGLEAILAEPLGFTFDANNALPVVKLGEDGKPEYDADGNAIPAAFEEPQFILCGSAAWAYNPKKPIKEQPVIINAKGIDRPMAKVTIESISSGEDATIEASQLFVTSIELVNIPNYVSINENKTPEQKDLVNFSMDQNGDQYGSITPHSYYKRYWPGSFTINPTFDAVLKQESGAVYYYNTKDPENGTAVGKNNYTPYLWNYTGNKENGQYGKTFPCDGVFRGQASLSTKDNKSMKINSGNYLDWLEKLDEELGDATEPTLESWTVDPHISINNAKWTMHYNKSYYIPENRYSNTIDKDGYSCVAITVAVGQPLIPQLDPQEIAQYVKDHWEEYKDKGEWQGSLSGDVYAKPVLAKTENGTNYYMYVFELSGRYKLTEINDAELDLQTSTDFDLDPINSKQKTFYVPIAKNYEVLRNHEYRLKIQVTKDTYNAIMNSARNIDSDIPLTVIREVKPLK